MKHNILFFPMIIMSRYHLIIQILSIFARNIHKNALESMDTKSRVDLFLKYYEHIEIISNEERNHNIFTIDFSPYMDDMKQYYQNNIKKDS